MVGPKYLSFRPIFQGLSTFSLYWASTSTSLLSSVILGIKSLPFPGPLFPDQSVLRGAEILAALRFPNWALPKTMYFTGRPNSLGTRVANHNLTLFGCSLTPPRAMLYLSWVQQEKLCSRPSESVMQTVFGVLRPENHLKSATENYPNRVPSLKNSLSLRWSGCSRMQQFSTSEFSQTLHKIQKPPPTGYA